MIRALKGEPGDRAPSAAPAAADELAAAIVDTVGLVSSRSGGASGTELLLTVPRGLVRAVAALAFAHGWDAVPTDAPSETRLRPAPR